MSNAENMRVWLQVDKTDPAYTKKLTFGAGFKPTVVDAQYQIKQATEVFGPIGIGWGIDNQTITPLQMPPLKTGDPVNTKLIYQAKLWIKDKEGMQRGFDFSSDIDLLESTKNGWRPVSDPVKKVSTDALTKALSRLGFAADIFMGRFDDGKYVQDREKEASSEREQKTQQEENMRKQLELSKNSEEVAKLTKSIDENRAALLKYKAKEDEVARVEKAFAPDGIENAELKKVQMLKEFFEKMAVMYRMADSYDEVAKAKKVDKKKLDEMNALLNEFLGAPEIPLQLSSSNPATKKSLGGLQDLFNKIDRISVS